MDWAFNTIWFDQIPTSKVYSYDWKQGLDLQTLNLSEIEYLTVWHHKNKEKNLSNLPSINKLKYLELNWSNSVSFEGIDKFNDLKRLELHYCTKIETSDGIASLSKSIEHLHINMSKKLKITEELYALTQLRVLRLNSCGNIENLNFLKNFPNLLDFRFVDTNIMDGNLDPIIEHPTICSVGFSDKRHYNRKSAEITERLQQRYDKLILKEVIEENRKNYAWPTSA